MSTPSWKTILGVQVIVLGAIAGSYAALSDDGKREVVRTVTQTPQPLLVEVPRTEPLSVSSFYDEPDMVTDDDLAAVLEKLLPRFSGQNISPNHVEHSLRLWGVNAVFPDHDEVMSGREMMTFLTDHATYLKSWGEDAEPILRDAPGGVNIRWGSEPGASVHHDHWLASLTEAGVSTEEPVYTPGGTKSIRGVIQESLRDFRLDERETEWSAMAFGLWIPPAKQWVTRDRRIITFDMLADRLMRGDCRFGVCHGTHRVYSLMLLWRLNEEHDILSDGKRDEVWTHLERMRDLITESQFEDGHWPSNWYDGKSAVEFPIDDVYYRKVISTGHHLEWLAIAPEELHPPREMIEKAARYVIEDTKSRPVSEIRRRYTFYSHVGRALALWRNTSAGEFWPRHSFVAPPAEEPVEETDESEPAH